jgi:hypothetical protein
MNETYRPGRGGDRRSSSARELDTLKKMGISKKLAYNARLLLEIKEQDPAFFQRVRRGEITFTAAFREWRRRQSPGHPIQEPTTYTRDTATIEVWLMSNP